jgi:hypothetical protein
VKYRFTATRTFWRSFGKLSARQQERARRAFAIFKENLFDPRLRSHKIQKLSARYARAIYAAASFAKFGLSNKRALFKVACVSPIVTF